MKIQHPETGKIIEIEGEPTEADLDSIFAEQQKIDIEDEHQNVLQEKTRISESLFPRATKANQSFFKSTLGAGMDALSLLGRGTLGEDLARQKLEYAIQEKTGYPGLINLLRGKKIDEPKETITGKMAQTEGGSFIDKLIRDPALLPGMATGSAGAKWVLQSGKWVPRVAKAAVVGAGEGTLTAGIHQTEDVAKGQKMSPKEVALEIGGSALFNTLMPVVGSIFKGAGTKFYTAGAKALEQKTALKKGANIDNLFKHKLAGGLDKSLDNVENKIEELGEELLKKVKRKRKVINLNDIFEETAKEFETLIESGKLTGQNKAIKNAIEELREELAISAPSGTGTAEKVLNIKRGWGKLGKWVRDASPELSAKQEVANKLTVNFNKKLLTLAPEAKKINKSLTELIPLKQPLRDAVAQAKRNDPVSLGDMLLFLAGGGAGLAQAGVEGGGAGVGLTAALITLRRLSKSPAFGSQVRKTGEKLLEKQTVSPIVTQTGRTMIREEK